MDGETSSQEVTLIENLLVIEDDGHILSRRIGQWHGKALLGAMTLPVTSLPLTEVHVTFLPQHELMTLDKIREAAQAIAPTDNLLFIDNNRKILSCRINPDNGVMLFESLPRNPGEASQTQSTSAHSTVTQASKTSNDQDVEMDGPQPASEGLHQSDANTSSSQLSTSGTPANIPETLPVQILSATNGKAYDREWMIKNSISEDGLNGAPSKHKLDLLVRYGAVKVGDRLCVTYHPDGGPVVKVGEVLQSMKKSRLDLRIAPARADFDGILYDCKGPKDIIGGMDKEFQMKRHSKASEAWKAVSVVTEDGRDLGSLWKVRQAYQVFTE
ncbi:hypothetical protein HO173_013007 [Letharia columbiana]|uniref:Uncharacterized protein n=1 Tax=Letharia columbiana TaxID=112416 RepID=A0A8H6CJB3_9LECA|nr:uncharacterized protein HO173_013007 [Letharia columbiana]KAF6224567.1 hypothetical protein HO173_013007 [Letharia columbiana]